jgi:hypothetical protein
MLASVPHGLSVRKASPPAPQRDAAEASVSIQRRTWRRLWPEPFVSHRRGRSDPLGYHYRGRETGGQTFLAKSQTAGGPGGSRFSSGPHSPRRSGRTKRLSARGKPTEDNDTRHRRTRESAPTNRRGRARRRDRSARASARRQSTQEGRRAAPARLLRGGSTARRSIYDRYGPPRTNHHVASRAFLAHVMAVARRRSTVKPARANPPARQVPP